MCGIFGFVQSAESTLPATGVKRVFRRLSLLSDSRGKEASGIAINDSKRISLYKLPARGAELVRQSEYQRLIDALPFGQSKPTAMIGHSRLETNGTHLLNKNNQPVVTRHLVGIHNGIVVNDQRLWQSVKNWRRRTDVDTEAMLAALDQSLASGRSLQESLSQLFSKLEGSATIAAYHAQLPYLIFATNTGSLFYVLSPGKWFIFSSEKYILQQILKDVLFFGQRLKIKQLKAGQAGALHLNQLHWRAIDLKRKTKGKIFPSKGIIYEIKDFSPTNVDLSTSLLVNNSLTKLQRHQPDYQAINKLRRCARCILPETMPLIKFDEDGVCNYCREHQPIKTQGWQSLEQLVAPYRRTDGEPDCIVAFSGGRDSSYGLHYLKNVLKMNPIAYTYDWGMITDLGRRNQARLVGKLGIEHILVSADIKQKRDNIRRNILAWLKKPDLGMVPLFMAGDKQAEWYAAELQRKTGIKLVFYCRGNELENEEFKWGHCGITGGSPQGVLHNLAWQGKLQLAGYYGRQFLTNPAYLNRSLIDTAFAYGVAYLMPLNFVYLWHYIRWDEKKIIKTLKQKYDWETESMNDVTWRIDDGSVAFYNYIFYIMQGFTENDTFRSNQIREGLLTRNQALKLSEQENQPRYQALKWYFDQLNLNGDEVLTTIDRAPRLY